MYFTTGAQLQAAINALPPSKIGNYLPFDAVFYAQQYMVGYSGPLTPIDHFVQVGANKNYMPNSNFLPLFYESQYADLQGMGFNGADLLMHFMQWGLDEGRIANQSLAGFDGAAYLLNNPDVLAYVQANLAQFGGSLENGAIAHYVKFGQQEGRQAFFVSDGYFTLTEAYVEETTAAITTKMDPIITKTTYWGYNPHRHEDVSSVNGTPVGVDNTAGPNDSNLTNEGPVDGGVPLSDLVSVITSYLGYQKSVLELFSTANMLAGIKDITVAGIGDALQGRGYLGPDGELAPGYTLNADGSIVDSDGNTVAFYDAKTGDYTGNYEITVTLNDGNTTAAQVALSAQQFAFMNGLLFDSEGNSRLFEVETKIWPKVELKDQLGNVILDADGKPILVNLYEYTANGITVKTFLPIVLTPTKNNGGTIEDGFTTNGDDTIVAGRLELLHGAYIDAGGGYNVLEVDAKGTFAQPLALRNIQEVRVENLPNVYTTNDSIEGSGYLDDSTYPQLSGDGPNYSVLDLSRAIHLERLVITEGDYGTGNTAFETGPLTVTGVRNGAVVRFEGGFADDVTVHYGEGRSNTEPLTVELVIGQIAANLNFVHDTDSLHLVSLGGGANSFGSEDIDGSESVLGGNLTTLTISGNAALYIRGDLDRSFQNATPITIDASANEGGVDLELSRSEKVTFIGSQANDSFVVDTYGGYRGGNGGGSGDGDGGGMGNGPGNGEYGSNDDESVTIIGGAGNDHYDVSTYTAVITSLNGNNDFEVSANEATVTAGSGNNKFDVDAVVANLTAGAGNNRFAVVATKTVLTAGNGNNVIEIGAGNAESGDTNNPGYSQDYETSVVISLGNGKNDMDVCVGTDPAHSITITAGNGGNTINAQGETVAITTGTGADVISVLSANVNLVTGGGKDVITLVGLSDDYTNVGSPIGGGGEDSMGGASSDSSYGDGAIIKIQTGTGANDSATINLGSSANLDNSDSSFPFNTGAGTITAMEGSSIAGSNITLVVNTQADLRAATLAGITRVILDDDKFVTSDAAQANDRTPEKNAMLTLTDKQFVALGATKFGVDGAIFNTHAYINIIVTETTSLTALGVDSLPSNIDLYLTLNDGVTLTMTAKQLHERVAPEGVVLADDGNTDKLTGKVVITGAGSVTDPITGTATFDPFNDTDAVRPGYGDATYIGGSLSDDFLQNGKWVNVVVETKFNGYVRPMDVEARQVIVVDTTNVDERVIATSQDTWIGALYIKGNSSLTLGPGASINLGENFVLDFSELKGVLTNFTLADFQDVKAVYGNSANYDATVYVKIKGTVGAGMTGDVDAASTVPGTMAEDTIIGAPGDKNGLVSKGVEKYVVVDIDDGDSATLDTNEFATIYLCDSTQDLETIALRGNFNATLNVLQVQSGISFELQGDGANVLGVYPKSWGPSAYSNVGALNVQYELPTDLAVINVNNQGTALTTRSLHLADITVGNAKTIQINVADGNAIFETIDGSLFKTLDVNSGKNVAITDALVLDTLTTVDAAGVAGTFAATLLGGDDATDAITFVGAGGATTVTLEGVVAAKGSSFTGAGNLTLIIGGEHSHGDGMHTHGATDLTNAAISAVDAVQLQDGATVVLTQAQLTTLGANNVTMAAIDTSGVVDVVGVGSSAIDSTAVGAGVSMQLTLAQGAVTINAASNLSNVSQFTMTGNTTVTMTAAQMIQLATSLAANGNNPEDLFQATESDTINITGLTQADVNWSIEFNGETYTFTELLEVISGQGWAGAVTLAESVNLGQSGHLDFSFNVGADMTLGVATPQQADGMVVNGGANSALKILFTDINGPAGNDPFIAIDASGYNVDTLRIPQVLADNGNIDLTWYGLPERVVKSIYVAGWVDAVDQTVTLEAGTTVPGWVVINKPEGDIEVANVTVNLGGGTEINGNLRLSTSVKEDDIGNSLFYGMLKSLTINSSGTEANRVTGSTANIIDGDITSQGTGNQPGVTLGGNSVAYTSIDNNLLAVSINATQQLVVTGSIIFESVVNTGALIPNDDKAIATLTVTGSSNVTIGGLDTSDADVDALNVVNNGTGTLSLTLTGSEVPGSDLLSFTGTGAITLNIASGAVDLTNDTLTAVTAISVASGATVSLTPAQLALVGASDITGMGTLNLMGLGSQPFDSTQVGTGVTVNVTTAAGTYTLDPATNLSNVATLTIPSTSTITMTADQALQLLAGTDTVLVGTGTVNITGVGQSDIDAGLETVLISMNAVSLAGNIEITENITLKGSTLNAALLDGFTFVGNGAPNLRVNVVMDVTVVGNNDVDGVKSKGIAQYVVTNLAPAGSPSNDNDTFYVCNSTQDLQILGLQGNGGDSIRFEGVKRGVTFLMEGDGVAEWVTVEKIDSTPDVSNIGSLSAKFYTANNPSAVVNINNQGVTLGASSTGGERKLLVDGVDIDNTLSVIINVADGDATITTVSGDQATGLTLNAVEDLSITNALTTMLTSINATGVAGAFTAQLNDMAGAFTLTTGGNATITLNGMSADAGTVIDGSAGMLKLVIASVSDLSAATLTSVEKIQINDIAGASTVNALTLNAGQVDTIGEANISGVVASSNNDKEVLNIVNMANQSIDASLLGTDVKLGTVVMAPGNWTLDPATNLAGAVVTVPAGGTLTLTADQYMALASLDGIAPLPGQTPAVINIVGLTQAHVDAGFTLAGVDNATGTVSLNGDVALDNDVDNNGTPDGGAKFGPALPVNNPNGLKFAFEVLMDGNETLTLTNSTQADGLKVTGGAGNTVVFKFIALDGTDTQIEASGYNVGSLKTMQAFYIDAGANNSGEENAEFVIKDLPGAVTLIVTTNPADLGITGYDRTVILEAGVTVGSEFVFNNADVNREVINLDITFSGNATINGDLRLPTQAAPVGKFSNNFSTLTIDSIPSATSTVNTILGTITPLPVVPNNPNPLVTPETENNLLNVVINATEDFVITGGIVFNKIGDNNAATAINNGSATVTVSGDANVALGTVNTDDNDVVGLTVNNTGTGTVSLTLNSAAIDAADALSFTGGPIALTIVGNVDLTNDNLSGVDSIKIDGNSTLTITQAQFDALGAANLLPDNDPLTTGQLHITEFGAAPFDATTIAAGINVASITLAGSPLVIELDPSTNLTMVDLINVPEGSTLRMTAAQFQQLQGPGTINGLNIDGDNTDGNPFTLEITGLTQADIDYDVNNANGETDGFSLVNVSNTATVSITLGQAQVNMAANTNLDHLGFVNGLTVLLSNGQTLGINNVTQASGLDVVGTGTTTIAYQFGALATFPAQIDASGYNVTNLKALAGAFTVGGNANVEYSIDDLPSSVLLILYANPGDIPGFLEATQRRVFIEEGITTPTGLIFNDWDADDAVTTLTLTLDGGVELNGNLTVPTRTDKNPALQMVYFDTLTVVSQGTAANTISGSTNNVIDGNISTVTVLGAPNTNENNLTKVVITATQDLVINGDIIFRSTDANDWPSANLTINGTADVTVDQLNVTDPDLSVLNVANNGTGTLTVTGSSPAIDDAVNSGETNSLNPNLETLNLSGTGDIVIGDANALTAAWAITAQNLSTINASGLTGDLIMGEVKGIDSESFVFTSGTGLTKLTLTTDTLDNDPDNNPNTQNGTGWTFNFASAGVGSEFHIGGPALSPVFADGPLNINLGLNTTLYIDSNTDLRAIDLTLMQTQAIVIADGVTLQLTAAQANGLTIIAGPDVGGNGFTGKVDVYELGTAAVDLSGISAAVAGEVHLGANDVTLNAATDLGEFAVYLVANNLGETNLSGQTIRFQNVAQAERDIHLSPNAYGDVGANSTNVVWLFDSVAQPVDTSGYFDNELPITYQVGRLWINQTLANGANIEDLFTTLPNSIVRVEFSTVTELNFLLQATGVDRIVELVAFTNLPNGLAFNDGDRLEYVQSLTISMGGQVTVGNIILADIVDPPANVNPQVNQAGIVFNTLTLNSYLALSDQQYLAPEAYDNDNDGTNEPGEDVQPNNINMVGDIGVGAIQGLDLLSVVLDTKNVAVPGGGLDPDAGANLSVKTITFDSDNVLGSVASILVKGANNVTIKSLDTSDPQITALSVTNQLTGTATMTITGGSPAFDGGDGVGNTETITIRNVNGSTTTFGSTKTLPATGEWAGIYGEELSMVDLSGNGTINLGTIASVDSLDFTINGAAGPDTIPFTGTVNFKLGEADANGLKAPTLAAAGTWTFTFAPASTANMTITDDVTFNAGGNLDLVNVDTLTILGNVDLSDLDINGAGTINTVVIVPAGSTLTITAADVNGITVKGAGVVNVVDLEDTPGADLSKIMTNEGDSGTVFATVDTSDGPDVDLLPETITLTAGAKLGIAEVTVFGGGTLDATNVLVPNMQATIDRDPTAVVDNETVLASFVVNAATKLILTAAQADDRTVSGAGTTDVEDIGLYAGANDFSLDDVNSAFVNIAVKTNVTLNSADDLGTPGANRVTTIDPGITLTAAGTVVDGQYIVGEDATLLVDDENDEGNDNVAPIDTPITANLANVDAEFIRLVVNAEVGMITFPVLYGDPVAKYIGDPLALPVPILPDPTVAVQTVILTAKQANGQTILGAGGGAQGEVNVRELGAGYTNLSLIDAGWMNANVPADATLDPATNLGDFKVNIDNNVDLVLTAVQANNRAITANGANGSVTVTALDDTPAANLDQIVTPVEIALLDAAGGVTLTGNLGSNMRVKITDSTPGGDTVTFNGTMVSSANVFELNANDVTLVLKATDAHLLTVQDNANNTTVIVNNLGSAPAIFTNIFGDTLTANVPLDAVLHPTSNLGGFTVKLAEDVDLGLTTTQMLNVGLGDAQIDVGDFTGTPGGVVETLTVTAYNGENIQTQNLGADVQIRQLLVEDTNGVVVVSPLANLSKVQKITIPDGTTLQITADQYQQLIGGVGGVTVDGDGTLNINLFDSDNALIDLSKVKAKAGTITLDPAAASVVVDPAAKFDSTGPVPVLPADNKFDFILSANAQSLTLSSETQADGRTVDGKLFLNTVLVLGFTAADATDANDSIDAKGFDVTNIWLLNTFIEDEFGIAVPTPGNIEQILPNLDDIATNTQPVVVWVKDTDVLLDLGFVAPGAIDTTLRNVTIDHDTTLDSTLSVMELQPGGEVSKLTLNMLGNSVITGDLVVMQDKNPQLMVQTENKRPGLFKELVINSEEWAFDQVTVSVVEGDLGAKEQSVVTFIAAPVFILNGVALTVNGKTVTKTGGSGFVTGAEYAAAFAAPNGLFVTGGAGDLTVSGAVGTPSTWTAPVSMTAAANVLTVENSVTGNVTNYVPAFPLSLVTTVNQGDAANPESSSFQFLQNMDIGMSVTINGLTVSATDNGNTPAEVASVFAGAVVPGLTLSGANGTPAGWTGAPLISAVGDTVTFTNTVNGNVANFTTWTGSMSGANEILGDIRADNGSEAPGDESIAESFTITLNNAMLVDGNEDQILFDSGEVNLQNGWGPDQVGAAIAGSVFQNYTATYDAGTNVVTFTNKNVGNAPDVNTMITLQVPANYVVPTGTIVYNKNNIASTGFVGSVLGAPVQGSFVASENNLYNVVINADNAFIVHGELELRYVTRSNATYDPTVKGTITVNGDANVTVGSVNSDDIHVTGVVLNNNNTGIVTMPGTSPGAAVGNTETLEINTVAGSTTNFGTAGDPTKPGVAGDELSLIDVNGPGTVNLGVLAVLDGDTFELNTVGSTGVVTATLEATLNAGGTWTFINGAPVAAVGDDLVLTINGNATFGAGTLILDGVTLILDGAVDFTNLLDLQLLNGTTLVIPAGESLTLPLILADGLTITGDGTLFLVGTDIDASAYDLTKLDVAFIDMSGITDAGLDGAINLNVSAAGATDRDFTITGSDFRDNITTGDGNDTVLGGLGDDSVNSGIGNDSVLGEEGNDTLRGVGGQDTLDGGDNDDSILGGASADTIIGTDGNDTINAGGGNDLITGGLGDDSIFGNSGSDTIVGFEGADTVDGGTHGAAGDTLQLDGTSLDLNGATDGQLFNVENIDASTAAAGVTLNLTLQSDGFVITGSDQADSILGSTGGDTIYAGDGNDTIVGFVGSDFIYGGDGNDTWLLDQDFGPGAGDGRLNDVENVSLFGAAAGRAVSLDLQTEALNITGSAFADTLTGGSGDDTITGGAGADILSGGNGDDVFVLNTGDWVAGETFDGGANTIVGDTVQVNANTGFTGGGVFTNIESIVLGSTVAVTFDSTALSGFSGLISGTGDNGGESVTVNGTGGDDLIDLSAISFDGNDIAGFTVNALAGNDTVLGSGGNDNITGLGGTDSIYGGGGNDTINGGNQSDTISGGGGNDLITTGGGTNILVFDSLVGTDTITDWGGTDLIWIENGIFADVGGAGALGAGLFASGAGLNASAGTEVLVYNTTTGQLYYDAGGSGGVAPVLIGTFTNLPAMVAADFTVI